MSTGYGPRITTDSLICYIDPSNPNSYSPPGPELVTNSNLLTIGDGNYETVYRDGATITTNNTGATVVANSLYALKWRNSAVRGGTGVALRTGGFTNPTKCPNFNQPAGITYIGGWIPSTSSTSNFVGDGSGTDLDIDYLSIRLMSKNISNIVSPSRNITLMNNPGYDDDYKAWAFLDPAYIEIPYDIDLNWDVGGTYGSPQKTIEMWVKTSDTTGALLSKPWNGNGQYNYYLDHDRLRVLVGGGGYDGDGFDSFYFPSISDNRWHHVIVWMDTTNFGVIIDASIRYSKKHRQSAGLPSGGNASIKMAIMTVYPYGNYSGSLTTSNCISGSVGLLRIYNKVLSPAEIQYNYISQAMRFRS